MNTSGIVAFEIASHLTIQDKQNALEHVEASSLPKTIDAIREWTDGHLERKKRLHKPRRTITPKSERPKCGAKTRAGGKCQARAVWNKAKDKPKNGRCRLHGGLSTGPKTPEGRIRSLAQLKYYKGS